jgi:two-component system alkaline phosphatase synthesis response regulator PhoP
MKENKPKKTKILLVDDEPDILEIVSYNLKNEGYRIYTAENGEEAIQKAKKKTPDLVILDVMMPVMDGIETCEKMRKIPSLDKTVITFLTARGEDYSMIAGFDAGADDYITKPVKPRVLVSKVKSLLRRHKTEVEEESNVKKLGDLIIDRDQYKIFFKKKEITLPRKEFELLSLLTSQPGKVFTREEILDFAWGNDVVVGGRTIDVHIRKLREKLGDKRFKTVKGVGYKYVNK